MSYVLRKDLADVLRKAGLTVVEISGWKTRGRPPSTGGFDPVGVLWHHTGSAQDGKAYAEWLAKTGRSDLPAPLCQLSIGRDGTVYVCAAGRANHAGEAKASGSVAAGDGNALYIGVECHNTGTEGWSDPQRDAMVRTGAALAIMLGTSPRAQRGHKETSVTGKWDPGNFDMDVFRLDLAVAIKDLRGNDEDTDDDEPSPTRVEQARDLLGEAAHRAKSRDRRARIRAALKQLPAR